MAYPQVPIQSPVEVKPARDPVIAAKFQITQVTEDFLHKTVRVSYEIQEADGSVISRKQAEAWYGDSYDAVAPWTDETLIARVTELVGADLADFAPVAA